MPQVKGSATWLTNVRQATDQRRVGIDQSEPKIENKRIERDMKHRLDCLHLQQHRALADNLYEVKITRDQVQQYSQMQELAKQNSVDQVLKMRQSDSDVDKSGTETVSKVQPEVSASSASCRRPMSTSLARRKCSAGFSEVDIVDSDEDDLHYVKTHITADQSIGSKAARPHTSQSKTAPRRRARTALSRGSGVLAIRRAVQAEFTEIKQPNRNRPHTALGVAFQDDDDEFSSSSSGAGYGGRSFQELRQASHIDKILNAEKETKRRQILDIRAEKRALEEADLQSRLQSFYSDLERFKKSSSRKVYSSFFR